MAHKALRTESSHPLTEATAIPSFTWSIQANEDDAWGYVALLAMALVAVCWLKGKPPR
jgi:hypothetical protein